MKFSDPDQVEARHKMMLQTHPSYNKPANEPLERKHIDSTERLAILLGARQRLVCQLKELRNEIRILRDEA
jgi:hypothetical protein